MEVYALFAAVKPKEISLLEQFTDATGINIGIDLIKSLITVIVIALFVYATARALYQWLAPKFGLNNVAWLARLMGITKIKEPTGYMKDDKWSWRTFAIITGLVLLSRFLVYYIGYAAKLAQDVNNGWPAYDFFSSFKNIWNRWDSPHYVDIARDWYVTEAQVIPPNDNYLFIVFFPLLPMLMRFTGGLVPNPDNTFYFASGCIISTVAMCIGCTYFYRLVKRECNHKVAVWSLLLLLFTPATFFFGICYTEALFLCLCIVFFYYLRKGNYWVAAIMGGLAAFTRSLGVLLAIPFFVEWLDCDGIKKQPLKNKLLRLLPIVVITSGTLAYLAINYVIYGDAFKFSEYQLHWHQQFSFFATNLAGIGQRVLTDSNIDNVLVMWLPEFLVIIGTIVLFLMGSGNKLRPSYLAFMMVYIVFAAAPSWLLSGVRYFAALFPVYILLGQFSQKHKIAGSVLMALSVVAMVAYTVGFVSGMQIM